MNINSLGDDACRPAYQAKLVEHLTAHRAELCEDCQRRLETNPLRVLDCKNEKCQAIAQAAPDVLQFLCEPCKAHFEDVKRKLDALGVQYVVNPQMVRGLDYYTRTTFEFIAAHPALGTASTVGGGGRYDKLVKSLGGPDVPAVGFGLGLDRLTLLLREGGQQYSAPPDVFIAVADEGSADEASEAGQPAAPRGPEGGVRHAGRQPEEPDEARGQDEGALHAGAGAGRARERQGPAQADGGRRSDPGGFCRACRAAARRFCSVTLSSGCSP